MSIVYYQGNKNEIRVNSHPSVEGVRGRRPNLKNLEDLIRIVLQTQVASAFSSELNLSMSLN